MRIALHHTHATQAERLAEMLRFDGHAVSVFESLHGLVAAPDARHFELIASSAGALARHEPRREIASLRSSGASLLAIAGLEDAQALAALQADDFVLEPCCPEELALRLQILAHRARLDAPSLKLAAPPYEFRADTREALLHGRPVMLTSREFELALFLFRRLGHSVGRSEIAEQVWGQVPHAASRTLDAHVSSLRRKLVLEPANGYRLRAHYGRGYCLTSVSSGSV